MLECEAKLGDHFLCISDQPVGFMDLDASRVQVLRNEITHLQEQNSAFWFEPFLLHYRVPGLILNDYSAVVFNLGQAEVINP